MTERWKVTINYKYAAEEDSNIVFIQEIEDLQSIVERGPDFRNVKNIEIVLNSKRLGNGMEFIRNKQGEAHIDA